MKEVKLSERANNKPSKIREISKKVIDLNLTRKQNGLSQVIDLSLGQPHIAVNDHMKAGIVRYLRGTNKGGFEYSPVAGQVDTCSWMSKLFNDYYPNLNYTSKEVMCTNGANQALWNAFSILIDYKTVDKDIIVTFSPYFGQYRNQVESLGGQLIAIDTVKHNFLPDTEKLEEILQSHKNVKAVLLNYPNNPTGINLNKNILERIANILGKFPGVALILDEVYRDLAYGEFTSILQVMPSLKDRSILIHSASKGLMAAPDLRLGIVAAPEAWIGAMSIQQLHVTASASRLTQIALTEVIRAKLNGQCRAWESRASQEFMNNTLFVKNMLEKVGFKVASEPQSGFFLLVKADLLIGKKIPQYINLEDENIRCENRVDLHNVIGTDRITDDISLTGYLLFAGGVALTPGSGFGLPASDGYLRVSCAVPMADLYKAINRISNALQLIENVQSERVRLDIDNEIINKYKGESVAIIGMGNVGEWILKNIISDIQRGLISNIDKIFLLGKNIKKLQAKCSDQIHELLIDQYNDSLVYQDHQTQLDLIDKLIATDNYGVLKETKYIITAFGAPMGPHIRTRQDLVNENSKIAREIGQKIKKYCRKDAVLINISNPLDVVTWILQTCTELNANQVIGVAGNLDLTRLAQGITKKTGCSYKDIDFKELLVLGEHGQHMVPIMSKVNIRGKNLIVAENQQTVSNVQKFSIFKGTKMMSHMNSVPPHIAPAKAAVTILRTLLGKESILMPCSAWHPEYQVYMGAKAQLNEHGVITIQDTAVSDSEMSSLKAAAEAIREMYNANELTNAINCVSQ